MRQKTWRPALARASIAGAVAGVTVMALSAPALAAPGGNGNHWGWHQAPSAGAPGQSGTLPDQANGNANGVVGDPGNGSSNAGGSNANAGGGNPKAWGAGGNANGGAGGNGNGGGGVGNGGAHNPPGNNGTVKIHEGNPGRDRHEHWTTATNRT